MGMDGIGKVLCSASHTQGKGGLGNEIGGMGAHHVHPENGP